MWEPMSRLAGRSGDGTSFKAVVETDCHGNVSSDYRLALVLGSLVDWNDVGRVKVQEQNVRGGKV